MWSGLHNRGHNLSNRGNSSAPYFCDYTFPHGELAGTRCPWSGRSALDLTLHKSDRHLIYPPGGPAALEAIDPILIAEKNEQRRRSRRAKSNSGAAAVQGGDDGDALAVLSGLTVKLDTPELVHHWISERKKRWPTPKAVERKRVEDEWRGRDPPRNQRPRPPAPAAHQVDRGSKGNAPAGKATSPSSDSDDSNTSSDSDSDSSMSSSDSDSDGRPEETVTSEPPPLRPEPPAAPAEPDDGSDSDDAPVEELTTKPSAAPSVSPSAPSVVPSSTRRVCKFWSLGNGCGHGSLCRDEHPTPDQMKVGQKRPTPAPSRQPPPKRPRRPAPPPPNPFAQPDLLRALLAREVAQHVDSTIQAIRFLAKNNWLVQVELEPGAAELQRKRRGLVQPLEPSDSTGTPRPTCETTIPSVPSQGPTQPAPAPMQAAWGDGEGTVHVVPSIDRPGAMTLQRTASPLLRPLTELDWPPEPDPLLFLDPMARDDPKPLKVEQYHRLALDPKVRTILAPQSELHPYGQLNQSLTRGLQSLLSLPTQAHRISAIELILGTAEPKSPTVVGGFTPGAVGKSRYTEHDLFRLGLKLGPMEVPLVRALATRVSEVLDGSVTYADDTSQSQTQEDQWRAEGERRDELRRMGIDLD